MAVDKIQIANIGEFMGLRTDTPASKCPSNYSPDCSDVVFQQAGMATRNPFRLLATLPAEIVWRKEFTCKDGSVQILAVDVNGVLYSVRADGTVKTLATIEPGVSVSSVTAYGREYMAFFNATGGRSSPLQWDGKNLSRVSQDGPGAPPAVSNLSLPSVNLVVGTGGAAIGIVNAIPINQQQIQTSSGTNFDQGYAGYAGYQPPQYESYYTSLQVSTLTAHGLTVGEPVTIAGNSLYDQTSYVSAVDSATTFEIGYFSQSAAVGSGGTVSTSGAILIRKNNVVTATTATPHSLRAGYQAQISQVPAAVIGAVTSIVINNEVNPGVATVTLAGPHGLTPGLSVTLSGVSAVTVGGSIVSTTRYGNVLTVVTTAAHGLSVGSVINLTGTGGDHTADGQFAVATVTSPTSFTISQQGTDGTSAGGTVTQTFPNQTNANPVFYSVSSVPTLTSFTVPLAYTDGTWNTGTVTFPWNGTFLVTQVLSATSFSYSQSGPDAVENAAGVVTPKGQIAPGKHNCVVMFQTKTGALLAPSSNVSVVANGTQYLVVQNIPIGPPNVTARLLAFTGANGSKYFALDVPPQVNGQVIGSSTLIDDNTTTSVVLDFSDQALFGGTAIDIPGNNLFQQVPLGLPRGVEWYEDRLFWIGEQNDIIGFQNMGFEGGFSSANPTQPLGWTVEGIGALTTRGYYGQAWSIINARISQPAYQRQDGKKLLEPNTQYTFQCWAAGSGMVTADFYSPTAGVLATATVPTSGGFAHGIFSARTPAIIPPDTVLRVSAGAGSLIDELKVIYTDNPNRNPLARASYVQNPEAYDALTGNIGPSDDSTELRLMFRFDGYLYFVTERRLYGVQRIGNSEPSSWYPYQIADKCGAFNANSGTTGKSWAAWGGKYGTFWFAGGMPQKTSREIAPTWRNVANITNAYDDADAERVYFGIVSKQGVKSVLTYDYHEVEAGGIGKWSPWNRPANWICDSASGPVFVIGPNFYRLDTAEGTDDDVMGSISGYYTLAPLSTSMFKKTFNYMGLRISGSGVLTPFLYSQTLATQTSAFHGQELSNLLDTIAEWSMNITGRLMFLKLGQPGVRFSLQDVTAVYQNDPNAPISGVR